MAEDTVWAFPMPKEMAKDIVQEYGPKAVFGKVSGLPAVVTEADSLGQQLSGGWAGREYPITMVDYPLRYEDL